MLDFAFEKSYEFIITKTSNAINKDENTNQNTNETSNKTSEETVTEEIEGSSDIVLDAEASDTTTEGESAE